METSKDIEKPLAEPTLLQQRPSDEGNSRNERAALTPPGGIPVPTASTATASDGAGVEESKGDAATQEYDSSRVEGTGLLADLKRSRTAADALGAVRRILAARWLTEMDSRPRLLSAAKVLKDRAGAEVWTREVAGEFGKCLRAPKIRDVAVAAAVRQARAAGEAEKEQQLQQLRLVPAELLRRAQSTIAASGDEGGKALYNAAKAGNEGATRALSAAGANVKWKLANVSTVYLWPCCVCVGRMRAPSSYSPYLSYDGCPYLLYPLLSVILNITPTSLPLLDAIIVP